MDNSLKDNVSNSLYEEICQRNLKLLRKLDQANLVNEKLANENNQLQSEIKALNRPLTSASCNLSVLSLLTLLFSFII